MTHPKRTIREASTVIDAVCQSFRVKPVVFTRHSKATDVMLARRVVIAILRSRGWSYEDIGYVIFRNHTSVMYLWNSNPPYIQIIADYLSQLSTPPGLVKTIE